MIRFVLALALFLSVAGCGGGSSSPTAPQPVAAVPAAPPAPAGLSVGTLIMKDRTAALSWSASTGATEYVVEVGSTAGGTDRGIHAAGAVTSFTLRDLPAGRSHVRLKARNSAGTSGASAEATLVLPDLADYIEALFLGGGPLIYESNLSCGRRGIWSAFPRGTTIRNLVSGQIPPQYRDAIRGVVDQIPNATAGRLATTFEVVAENPVTVGENQMVHVALQTPAELQFACGSTGGVACMGYNSPLQRATSWPGGLIRWSVGYYVVTNTPTTRPYAHEPGHGVLGMCHINADVIGGRQHSLMSASDTPAATAATSQSERLSPFDIEALQAVYGSSLAIGANRSDFVAAGLLRP